VPFDPWALLTRTLGELTSWSWARLGRWATIGPDSRSAAAFAAFGRGSAICFPVAALYGEEHIAIGSGTVVGPYCSLSAGVAPGHVPARSPVVRIGDRCVIGKGSGIVAHADVRIGDDVWTGHHVYVTDANHGYEDVTEPPGVQFAPPRPVRIGDRAWIGHGSIVLPGSTIGEHAVIGAGAVVTGAIPAFSVAVGNPARVIRRYVAGVGWRDTAELPLAAVADPEREPTRDPEPI
jgi:acetyltransferase-like isoleucine patch superfamily enzyme